MCKRKEIQAKRVAITGNIRPVLDKGLVPLYAKVFITQELWLWALN